MVCFEIKELLMLSMFFFLGRIYAAGGRGERVESGYAEDGTFISRKSRLLIPSAVQLSIYYKGLPFCPPPSLLLP